MHIQKMSLYWVCKVAISKITDLRIQKELRNFPSCPLWALIKLLANESKTAFIFFGKRPPGDELKIRVGNEVITETATLKFLGINFSSDLKWDTHVTKLKNVLLSRLYLIRHLSTIIPRSCMKIIADGLFNSTLRYGICLFLRPCLYITDPIYTDRSAQNIILRHGARDKPYSQIHRSLLYCYSISIKLCGKKSTSTMSKGGRFHDLRCKTP